MKRLLLLCMAAFVFMTGMGNAPTSAVIHIPFVGNPPASTPTTITNLGAGSSDACYATNDGGVKCWGYNHFGAVGDGTNTPRNAPIQVVGLQSGVKRVFTGLEMTCAIMTDANEVKCWGYRGYTNTETHYLPETVMSLGNNVVYIAVGWRTVCVLTSASAVQCLGSNRFGELGAGTQVEFSETPLPVVGLESNVIGLSISEAHACAVTRAGAVKCWGSNNYGQLGDGTLQNRNAPVQVVGLEDGVMGVSTGGDSSCAVTRAGAVKCWGRNDYGQVDGSTIIDHLTPTQVVGLESDVKGIEIGYAHGCALTTLRALKCWGANLNGEIGTGGFSQRSPVVTVTGLESGVIAAALGTGYTMALTADGTLYSWGANHFGQLGDGSNTGRNVPGPVLVEGQ